MRKTLVSLLVLLTFLGISTFVLSNQSFAEEASDCGIARDVYSLSLKLKVPQVFANTKSLGYRKYQWQNIKGDLVVKWMADGTFQLEFENLVNKNFKVGGKSVEYNGYEDRELVYTRYNYIGNNATESFKTPCLCFYLELEPSYAIGGNNEDNSFYLILAGSGNSIYNGKTGSRMAKQLKGYVAGTQGCGCSAYFHKSPTRVATLCGPSDILTDVVATWGTWTAKFKTRISCGETILCR